VISLKLIQRRNDYKPFPTVGLIPLKGAIVGVAGKITKWVKSGFLMIIHIYVKVS